MVRYKNVDFKSFKCMGLSDRGRCLWLNIPVCKGAECAFMHTVSEDQSKITKNFERLASLSDSRQIYIANKYYRGEIPWKKERYFK